jgi:hypothetical protein
MFAICRVLLVLALGAALVGAPAARADDKKPAKPGAEPAKPIVIHLDASKLPPEVLKQLLQLAEKSKPAPGESVKKPGADTAKLGEKHAVKPGVKPAPGEPTKPSPKPAPGKSGKPGEKVIGLADAVAIAEKVTQGSAVGAERKGDGAAAQFWVEVQGVKGGRSQVTIAANGKVTETKDGREGQKDKAKKK